MKKIIFSAAIVISSLSIGLASIPTVSASSTRIGSLSIISVSMDQKTITVTPPTSNSPGAWSISLDNPALATINGLTLTLKSVGVGQLTFTQAASGSYNSASRATVFRVNPGHPTIGTFGPLTAPLTAGTYPLTPPTSNSTGPWFYSLSNNVVDGKVIATLSGNVVTLIDAGVVTITAAQAATANFLLGSATTTLTITAIKPTIGAFPDLSISRDSVGVFSLKVPSSNSSGAWTFTSSTPAVATVNGTTVTPVGVGTTVITGYQAPNGGYGSATVKMNLSITSTAPTVGTLSPINFTLGTNSNSVLLVPPTSNSTGTWSFTVADPSIATVNGSTLSILKSGSTTITAQQNPTSSFGYSAKVSAPLVISEKAPIPAMPSLNQVVGDPVITIVPPTTPSTGTWSLSSSDSLIASVSGLAITVGNAGTATITLTQSANGNWLANSTTFTVTVTGLVPTLGTLSPITLTVGTPLTPIPAPSSNSSGAWSYSISDSNIAKVVNGSLVGVAVGTTMLSAVQKPAGKYGQSNTVQTQVTVKAAPVATPSPSAKPSPSATPKASATPTPSPSPTLTPMPTPSKTTTPKPTAIPKPTHSSLPTPVVPIVSAKLIGHVIRISSNNPNIKVIINGADGKIGNNVVHPGTDLVIIEFGAKVIYSRVFTVK